MLDPRRRRDTNNLETEADLVRLATSGDMRAFEQLAGAYADRIFAMLLGLLGDRSEAEDVVQDVMLRAWRGIRRFDGRSLFFTWLYRIAINEANRSLEKRSRRPAQVAIDANILQLPAAAADEPASRYEQAELRAALREALAGLPTAYRTAIVLRDFEGLSTQQAAQIEGISQAAFKSRLHEARLRVRAGIGDEALLNAAP